MGNLTRYRAADLPELMERISRNSIGLDDYFNQFFDIQTTSNYPPYNIIQVSNHESRLEIALAGFKKEEINVYTEYGKLFVKGQKQDKDENTSFVHKGVAQRDFERAWSLSDETEIKSVSFEDGLLVVEIVKIVPEHHARKDWL